MNNFKKHKYESQPQSQSEEEQELDEKWRPTPEAFEAFQERDLQLATHNVRMALGGRFPISFKELKESTLHSADTIERVLASGIATASILESKGKYSLALPNRSR